MTDKNKPVQKFSAGAVSATVWANHGTTKDGQPATFSTVTLQRAYQKDGAWQHTGTLRVNDLPKAAMVIQKAYEFLALNKTEAAG